MNAQDQNISPESIIKNGTWKEALTTHLLLTAYWFVPKSELKLRIKNFTKKEQLLIWIHIIGVSLFLTLVVQAIIDGPQILTNYYRGNFSIHSQLLQNWAILSFLLLFGILTISTTVFPYGVHYIFVKLGDKNRPREKLTKNFKQRMFISSAYSLLSILFYFGLVYCVISLAFWNKFHLIELKNSWYDAMYIAFAILLFLAIGGYAINCTKITNCTPIIALIKALVLLIFLGITFATFFLI